MTLRLWRRRIGAVFMGLLGLCVDKIDSCSGLGVAGMGTLSVTLPLACQYSH